MAGVIKIGDKIELGRRIGKNSSKDDFDVYTSQVLDFRDGEVIIAMPISEGHVIPLEIGTAIEAFFYTASGIYKCDCKITNRGKEDNIFMCSVVFLNEPKKFQRREYYRLSSSLDATAQVLDLIEIFQYAQKHTLPEKMSGTLVRGTIVDISGGGVRLMSDYKFTRGDYVLLTFVLDIKNISRKVQIVAKIIQSTESPKRARFYDSRLQFKEVTPELRDIIVKYIFEQQRMIQQKERG